MECQECVDNRGEPAKVEYTDGTTETVYLCEDCRVDFTDGGLIQKVESNEAN